MTSFLRKFRRFCTASIRYRPYQLRYYRLPALALFLDVVLVIILLIFYSYIGILDEMEEVEEIGVEIASLGFLFTIISISVIEELIFRIIPLWIAIRYLRSPWYLITAAFITAIVFGYVHGGVYNILLQGIGGFLYAIIFIRYAAGGKRILEASLVIIILHTIFNGLLSLLLYLSGETMF